MKKKKMHDDDDDNNDGTYKSLFSLKSDSVWFSFVSLYMYVLTLRLPCPLTNIHLIVQHLLFRCIVCLSSRQPAALICPHCHQSTYTTVSHHPTAYTYASTAFLCLVFLPMFWLPVCVPACNSSEHHCSRCDRIIGTVPATSWLRDKNSDDGEGVGVTNPEQLQLQRKEVSPSTIAAAGVGVLRPGLSASTTTAMSR